MRKNLLLFVLFNSLNAAEYEVNSKIGTFYQQYIQHQVGKDDNTLDIRGEFALKATNQNQDIITDIAVEALYDFKDSNRRYITTKEVKSKVIFENSELTLGQLI